MQEAGVARTGTSTAGPVLAIPPALVAGDLAAIVAPSSPYVRDELWRGLAWLRTRYRLRMSASALRRDGYLAGTDTRRRDELAHAMLDPDVKAIVAARGGYGAMRIVTQLPWKQFAERPKWIIGFSDVTALHVGAWRCGVASAHAPNATGLGRGASPSVRAAWIAAIERPHAPRRWPGLRVVRGGRADGIAVGGNLSVLHAMAAAGELSWPPGVIILLEDVAEAPYRVDRMLTSLVLGGYFTGAAALVFGQFERCGGPGDGRTLDELFEERTRSLAIPVLAGAPFGHGEHNEAFVLGSRVSVGDGVLHWNG